MHEAMLSKINLTARPSLTAMARVQHRTGTPRYLLPDHWVVHLYDYYAHITINDRRFEIFPGCLTLVPPGMPVQYEIRSKAVHYYAHFKLAPPEPDQTMSLPVHFDLRGDLYRFEQGIIEVGRSFLYRENPLHAEIKLWDFLWNLGNCGAKPVARRHPSMEKALALIDAKLGEEISVTALAHDVGISRNHLTRLFQMEKEITVVAYVRQQRARRAKHLLESTTLPISSIAAQVHSPNLQSFSALLKQETGHPPTFWRKAKSA